MAPSLVAKRLCFRMAGNIFLPRCSCAGADGCTSLVRPHPPRDLLDVLDNTICLAELMEMLNRLFETTSKKFMHSIVLSVTHLFRLDSPTFEKVCDMCCSSFKRRHLEDSTVAGLGNMVHKILEQCLFLGR